jgi:SAM-dependent methyltransferase
MFNYNLFIKRLSNHKSSKESFIKNEMAKRLLKRLDFIKLNPTNILVLGYFDDAYIDLVKARFPNTNIQTTDNGEDTFDIVISNSTIHLTDSITDVLDDYYDMLNDDGVLLFSTFGDKNLNNIKSIFDDIDSNSTPHTNGMIDAKTWAGILQSSQYKTPAMESDIFTLTYENINTLFTDVRELNEPLADTKMKDSFTGKKLWNEFIKKLEQELKLNIEALYAYAVKKKEVTNKTINNNSNRMSLDDLKKQIAEFKKN